MEFKLFLTPIAAAAILFSGLTYADQPAMNEALKHLQMAKGALEKAVPNKGGHRERAIELINRAMDEVIEGKKYAREHGRDR